jgi:hypothetical protein
VLCCVRFMCPRSSLCSGFNTSRFILLVGGGIRVLKLNAVVAALERLMYRSYLPMGTTRWIT